MRLGKWVMVLVLATPLLAAAEEPPAAAANAPPGILAAAREQAASLGQRQAQYGSRLCCITKGAIIGAAVGAAGGAMLMGVCDGDHPACEIKTVALLGAIGAGLGAVVGSFADARHKVTSHPTRRVGIFGVATSDVQAAGARVTF